MQQPPGRPQWPPENPPPHGYPPPGVPPQYPHQPAATMQYAPQQQAVIPPPPLPRKNRGWLRMLAGACISSAWLTLAVTILGTILAYNMAAGLAADARIVARSQQYFSQPAQPLTGAQNPLANNPYITPEVTNNQPEPARQPQTVGEALRGGFNLENFARLMYFVAVISLIIGVVTFFAFLAIGKMCYALLEVEDQQYQMQQVLQSLLMRLGGVR